VPLLFAPLRKFFAVFIAPHGKSVPSWFNVFAIHFLYKLVNLIKKSGVNTATNQK
jgi:hypothetical protein